MKTLVKFVCLLIATILCEAEEYIFSDVKEAVKIPDGCDIVDEGVGDYFIYCPNVTMAIDELSIKNDDGQTFVEYKIIIDCSPESMPYNYLPHMQSKISLELSDCQPPPENGSFGDGGPKLEYLKFENHGDMGPLKREHFSGLNNLWNLKLITNSSHEMPDDLFTDLTNLKYLEMLVLQVNKNIFTNLTALETLHITIHSRENTNDFDTSALTNSPSFKTLNWYSNSFTRLTKRFFGGCQNVESLDIRYSNIEAIDPDAFEPMTNLRNVHMFFNVLASLPEGLFARNKKLEKVEILFSPKLHSLPPLLFSHLPNLREIEIKCKLTSIPNDLIEGSTNLEILNLQYNELTSLPRDLLRNHSNLKEIFLYGNKFNTKSTDLFDGKSPLTEVRFVRKGRRKQKKF